MFDSDDEFMAELQGQWEQDRARKGQRKKERMAARLAATASKAERKRAKRAGVEVGFAAVDMFRVNESVREYLMTPSQPSLALQPMAKRDRVAVHLLAEAYFLKSESKGSGSKRFPILTRTARTSIAGADQRKIQMVLDLATGKTKVRSGPSSNKGRSGSLWRELQGEGARRLHQPHKKNRDGDIVGSGAAVLQEDNIGHQLLSKMGWRSGETMGLTGGIAVPIAAVVKNGRGGLGHQ